MTSIVRVKRKRNEDPADSLLLSCKRKRHLESDEVTSLFSFAGTLDSKDAPVPGHITEVIRQTKSHKLQHPHSSDFQRKPHNPEEINRLRQQSQQSSKAKRYHITCRHRTLDGEIPGTDLEQEPLKDSECGKDSLKSDDKENSSASINSNADGSVRKEPTTQTNLLPQHLCPEKTCCEQKEEVSLPTDSVARTDSGSVLLNGDKMLCSADSNTKQSEQQQKKTTGENPLLLEGEQVVCMLDVENVPEKVPDSSAQHVSSSGITLNGVPMVSRKADTPGEDVGETEYVYDLYYTNTNLSDLDLEAVLTVEALWQELGVEDETFRDCDPVNEESEDSNDEGNWRNDYPDEDPHFFENEDQDYGYEDNMVESNFVGDDDDVGALTAYWMDSMCRLDAGDNLDRDEDDDGSDSDDDYDKLDF